MLALAKHHPSKIYFTDRDATEAASLIDRVKESVPSANLMFIECDLGSLESVKAAVEQFSSCSRLDVLICNADIMAQPMGLTRDGYEIHFGTNHLGHALLIKLLLPTLLFTTTLRRADVRIVIRSSLRFHFHPRPSGIAFKDLRTVQDLPIFGSWYRYGQSKLANILYAAELARRYPATTSVSVIPGIYVDEFGKGLSFPLRLLAYLARMTGIVEIPGQGASNQLWAAVGMNEDRGMVNGGLYGPDAVFGLHGRDSRSEKLAAELWEWTRDALEEY